MTEGYLFLVVIPNPKSFSSISVPRNKKKDRLRGGAMVHLTMAQATYALNNGLGPNTIVELEQLPYWMEFSVCQR